jgi:hypothetical protein
MCSFELGAESGKMFKSMVMANTAEVAGTMDLAMAVSSAIMTSHSGIVNSIAVIQGFLRRGIRISRGRCTGGFGVFLFNEGGRRGCIGS